ncbi:hypothetical protein LMG33810_002710 [Carnimonas sp. LMG 33810]
MMKQKPRQTAMSTRKKVEATAWLMLILVILSWQLIGVAVTLPSNARQAVAPFLWLAGMLLICIITIVVVILYNAHSRNRCTSQDIILFSGYGLISIGIIKIAVHLWVGISICIAGVFISPDSFSELISSWQDSMPLTVVCGIVISAAGLISLYRSKN